MEMVHVDIAGPIGDLYRKEVLAKIKRNLHTTGANKWSTYQLCKEIKQEGDNAFRLGKGERAKSRYKLQLKVFNSYGKEIHFSGWTKWYAAMYGLAFRTEFNQVLLSIKYQNFDLGVLHHVPSHTWTEDNNIRRFSNFDLVRLYHYSGLVYAELGCNDEAFSEFGYAL